MIDSFVIKIYNNSIFVGYIKDTRLHRNGYYRFNKTKNIDKCMKYHLAQMAMFHLHEFLKIMLNLFAEVVEMKFQK